MCPIALNRLIKSVVDLEGNYFCPSNTMSPAYTIFGRQVPSHILSIATLGATVAVVAWPRSKTVPNTTPEEKSTIAAPAADLAKGEDFDLDRFLNDISKDESKN